jgi:hypothetical protein
MLSTSSIDPSDTSGKSGAPPVGLDGSVGTPFVGVMAKLDPVAFITSVDDIRRVVSGVEWGTMTDWGCCTAGSREPESEPELGD